MSLDETDDDGVPLYACIVEQAPISMYTKMPKGIKGSAIDFVRKEGGPLKREDLRKDLPKSEQLKRPSTTSCSLMADWLNSSLRIGCASTRRAASWSARRWEADDKGNG